MADLSLARVQVLISELTPYGQFNDALYYTTEEFEALKDEDVEAAKQERIDAWVAGQEAQKDKVAPTEEEPLAKKTALEDTVAEAQEEIAAIEAQLA